MPSDGLVIRDNPGFRDPETGEKSSYLDENLPSKKYHGTTDLPIDFPTVSLKAKASWQEKERVRWVCQK